MIDRIKTVDDKIVPVDLTIVFKEIGKLREEVAMLDIPEETDLSPINKSLKELKDKLTELEKQVAIVKKENEVQDVVLEEIKLKSNNPLSK